VFANKFKVSNYFEEQNKPLKEKESQVSSVVDPMAESFLYAQSRLLRYVFFRWIFWVWDGKNVRNL